MKVSVMSQTQNFNPIDFDFHRLDFAMGDLQFYEKKFDFELPETPDFHRLNVYLSQDGNFVTIWFGLLETFSVDQLLEKMGIDLDASQQYNEPLFRGYIDSNETEQIILKALRLDKFTPQFIHVQNGEFRCDFVSDVVDQ